MERQMLRLTLMLGVLVTILGGTGVFAVFSDQARAGTNDFSSGELAPAADLKLAYGEVDPTIDQVNCGAFQDNLTSLFSFGTNVQPGYTSGETTYCLQNAGAAPVDTSLAVTDLINRELACTGDEGSLDLTCGQGAQGELSPLLDIVIGEIACDTATPSDRRATSFAALSGGAESLPGTAILAPGEVGCWTILVQYPRALPADVIQRAQSDIVHWTFVFTGTAS
jgi:predicted ribosomally synthesized peptide with SipW-like signal peptide